MKLLVFFGAILLSTLTFAVAAPHAVDRLKVHLPGNEWTQFQSAAIFNTPLLVIEKKDRHARGFMKTEFVAFDPKKNWSAAVTESCHTQSGIVKAKNVDLLTSPKLPDALVCQFEATSQSSTTIYTLVYSKSFNSPTVGKVQSVVLTHDRSPASTMDPKWIVNTLSFDGRKTK